MPIIKEVVRIESDEDSKPVKRKADKYKKETHVVAQTDLPVINYETHEEETQRRLMEHIYLHH